MEKLFELMQCFDARGRIYINQFKELILKFYYEEEEFDFERISYEEAEEYGFDVSKAHNYEKQTVEKNYQTYLCYKDDYPIEEQIISSLSRPAHKEGTKESREWILDGINKFLGTKFNDADIELIYTKLGNGCNPDLRKKFVESNYDMNILRREEKTK